MNYIHPSASIASNVELGDNIYIGPGCIIGFPPEHKGFFKNTNNPGVKIGNGCVLTGLVTIDAGTENQTVLGENVWMLKHSHAGHDAIIGNDVTISCGAKIGGHCKVGDKCNIGLNATIHQRQVIEEGCMIGMGAVVTKKLITEPYSKYAGVPAKLIGDNLSQAKKAFGVKQ